MMKFKALAALAALLIATPALAQNAGHAIAPAGFAIIQAPCTVTAGQCYAIDTDHPAPVSIATSATVPVSDASGSLTVDCAGSACATAANQTANTAAITSLAGQVPATLGAKTGANSLSVVPASDATYSVTGTVASAATDSGNPVKMGCVYRTTRPTYTDGQRTDCQSDTKGNLGVAIFGANNLNAAATQAPNADNFGFQSSYALVSIGLRYDWNGSNWDRSTKPNATSRLVSSAATTNATVGKASAGSIAVITGYNSNAAIRYLKIYNKATSPTVGTDTPILTLVLPPTAPFTFALAGEYFSTGISYALTTGSADNDTGAVGSGDILGLNVIYN